MYPFIRMTYQILKHRNDAPLGPDGVHVSHHICWPWDIDFMLELNNGRTLTLYDLGRIPFSARTGLWDALQRRKWKMAMAGATVRWRRRVHMFQLLEMRTAYIGHDARFIYAEQTLRHKGETASSIVYRIAVTGGNGILPPSEVIKEMNGFDVEKPLPEWVVRWSDAENTRVWPPET